MRSISSLNPVTFLIHYLLFRDAFHFYFAITQDAYHPLFNPTAIPSQHITSTSQAKPPKPLYQPPITSLYKKIRYDIYQKSHSFFSMALETYTEIEIRSYHVRSLKTPPTWFMGTSSGQKCSWRSYMALVLGENSNDNMYDDFCQDELRIEKQHDLMFLLDL